MDNRLLVYDLLYQALIDIRYAAHEGKSHRAVYKVADLFHNLPSQIEQAEKEQGGFSRIVIKLKRRAQLSGCETWLDNAIQNFQNRN